MKLQFNPLLLFAVILSIAVVAGCSSTRKTSSAAQEGPIEVVDSGYDMGAARNTNQSNMTVHPNRDNPSNQSLADMMRRLPGVRISGGDGPYAKVVVGGASGSFMAGTDPLFVVNGQTIGSDFSQVYGIVNPNDVVSLNVLKGSDATIYGSRGANGVILIRTK